MHTIYLLFFLLKHRGSSSCSTVFCGSQAVATQKLRGSRGAPVIKSERESSHSKLLKLNYGLKLQTNELTF